MCCKRSSWRWFGIAKGYAIIVAAGDAMIKNKMLKREHAKLYYVHFNLWAYMCTGSIVHSACFHMQCAWRKAWAAMLIIDICVTEWQALPDAGLCPRWTSQHSNAVHQRPWPQGATPTTNSLRAFSPEHEIKDHCSTCLTF